MNSFCQALSSSKCHLPCQDAPCPPSLDLESMRSGGSSWHEGSHSGHLSLWYEQLLSSTHLSKMPSSPSRCPLSMKSGFGVFEDWGSSWHELSHSGHLTPWYEQLLPSTHLSKMSSSPSRYPLSMKSWVGVYEDRGSSLEELDVQNTILGDLVHSYQENQLPLFEEICRWFAKS